MWQSQKRNQTWRSRGKQALAISHGFVKLKTFLHEICAEKLVKNHNREKIIFIIAFFLPREFLMEWRCAILGFFDVFINTSRHTSFIEIIKMQHSLPNMKTTKQRLLKKIINRSCYFLIPVWNRGKWTSTTESGQRGQCTTWWRTR